jgi:hypothetical protein
MRSMECYSSRNASVGWIRSPRSVGRRHATTPTRAVQPNVTARVSGRLVGTAISCWVNCPSRIQPHPGGVVLLPPGELPADANASRYLQAVASAESAGQFELAIAAYRTAALYWPGHPLAMLVTSTNPGRT